MTASVRNAVAVRDETQPTVAQYISRLTPEIARALPKHMDAARVARLALTVLRLDEQAVRKAGKPGTGLAACKPESFAGALLTASALGLEPGVNGEAYLVGYKGECTLIVGYQGYSKLFWQHPLAQHLDAQAVYERDEFDYALGTDSFLTHKPALSNRGAVIAYYAVAGLTSGARIFVVLSPGEVKALRGGKVGSSGGIADPMHWMERKTALRQLFKLLPKSPMLARAVASDERTGSDLRAEVIAEAEPAAAIAAPPTVDVAQGEAVNTATGEVLPVEDPPNPPAGWTDVEARKPADA